MITFHRMHLILQTVLFHPVILLVLLGMAFLPACSRENTDPPVGSVSSEISDQTGRAMDQAPDVITDTLQDERQKDIDRLHQLQVRLIALQQKVLQDNPDVQDDQTALREAIESKLQQILDARNVDVTRIQELQARFQDPNIPEEEKMEQLGEFQSLAQQYNQARAETMNDEQVQEKYTHYVTRMQALMEKEDAEAPALTREFEELQTRLSQPRQ